MKLEKFKETKKNLKIKSTEENKKIEELERKILEINQNSKCINDDLRD